MISTDTRKSASPSSTLPPAPAPALLTPVSSTGYATDSGAGISYVSDHHGALSPRSISGSTTSTGYSTIPARVLSPLGQKSMTNLQSPPDLRVSVAHPHGLPEGSGQWQGSQHHMPPATQQFQQQLGSQSARGSWDMSTYLESSATTAGGTSTSQNAGQAQTPSLNYPSTRNIADTAGTGGDNNSRMGRSLSGQQNQSHQMPRT